MRRLLRRIWKAKTGKMPPGHVGRRRPPPPARHGETRAATFEFYPPPPAARNGQALARRGLSAPIMRAGSGKPPAVHGAWKSLGSAMQGGGRASSPRLRQPAARSGSAGTGSATHPPPCMACCNVDQSAAPGVRLALPGGAHAGRYVISGCPRLSVSGGSGGQGWMADVPASRSNSATRNRHSRPKIPSVWSCARGRWPANPHKSPWPPRHEAPETPVSGTKLPARC